MTLSLGLFLLASAGLKVHGLIVDPYGQDNFLALPWLQLLTIEIELLLGLWLLSKLQPQLAWYVTLAFFVALACFSFTLAYQGQATCGCFGKVEVNPWYTFVLDVVIVAVMVLLSARAFPGSGARDEGFPPAAAPLSSAFQITLFTTLLIGILALGFTLITGDPWAALARLKGQTLEVIPAVTQLGEGNAGEARTFQVQLRNYSNKPIRVVGGTNNCACITLQDLPISIPAGETKFITVIIKFSGTSGKFTHRFVFFSDAAERLTVARFAGSILPVSPFQSFELDTSNTRQQVLYVEDPTLSAN